MATVEGLQQAASELRAVADEVRAINPPVLAASGPDVLSGGNIGDSLAAFIDDQRIIGLGIAAELDELANIAAIGAATLEREEAEAAAEAAVVSGAV